MVTRRARIPHHFQFLVVQELSSFDSLKAEIEISECVAMQSIVTIKFIGH